MMNGNGKPPIKVLFCDVCLQVRAPDRIVFAEVCVDMHAQPVPKELGVAVWRVKLCRDNTRCINQASEWKGQREMMPKIGDVVDLVEPEGRIVAAIVTGVLKCQTPGRAPALNLLTLDPDPGSQTQAGAPVRSMLTVPHASAVVEREHILHPIGIAEAGMCEDCQAQTGTGDMATLPPFHEGCRCFVDLSALPGGYWRERDDGTGQLRREVEDHRRTRALVENRAEMAGASLDKLADLVRQGHMRPTDIADRISEISDDVEGTGDAEKFRQVRALGGAELESLKDPKITPIGKAAKADPPPPGPGGS